MELALIYKNDRDADCFGNANCLVQSNNYYIQDTTNCGNTYRNCQSGTWLNKNDGLVLKIMIGKNIRSEPIEVQEIIHRDNKDFLLNGSISRNKLFNDEIVLYNRKYNLDNIEPMESFTSCYLDDNQELAFNSKYKEKLSIDKYDTKYNVTEYLSNLKDKSALIWGYNLLFQIAKISNASLSESGHTSFENNELNGWSKYDANSFITIPENVFTGKGSMSVTGYGPYQIFTVGQNAEKHSGYKASVWTKGKGAYLHIEVNGVWSSHVRVNNEFEDGLWHKLDVELPRHKIQPYFSQGENLKIKVYVGSESGTVYFDDLRFHPSDAQMTTYTHEPLIGVTSISNESNKPEFYIYDPFGRLELVKDFEGNIIKKNDYHYRTDEQ